MCLRSTVFFICSLGMHYAFSPRITYKTSRGPIELNPIKSFGIRLFYYFSSRQRTRLNNKLNIPKNLIKNRSIYLSNVCKNILLYNLSKFFLLFCRTQLKGDVPSCIDDKLVPMFTPALFLPFPPKHNFSCFPAD